MSAHRVNYTRAAVYNTYFALYYYYQMYMIIMMISLYTIVGITFYYVILFCAKKFPQGNQ